MRNILAKELKIKFIETLNGIDGFSYEDGNPFFIKIGARRFFIFLKNLSPAYFQNSPDVTRVQLPFRDQFGKVFKANIPFIILGYDVDNDTVVCWNPLKVKERLNAKSNVSLYSRNSLQSKIKKNEFKTGYLSNGEKIVLFNRETLPYFFDSLSTLFLDTKNATIDFVDDKYDHTIVSEPTEEYQTDKLFEIVDKDLLIAIRPLLLKNRVLEAVEVCTKHYANKYKNMGFKDWFRLVNNLYQKINSPFEIADIKSSKTQSLKFKKEGVVGEMLRINNKRKGVLAYGQFCQDGKSFKVFAGSTISKTIASHFADIGKAFDVRRKYENNGTILDHTFSRDVEFNSISLAAKVVLGCSVDGKQWESDNN